MFHFLVSQAGALIQYMFILRPAQGYLRRMIFMEFIESSHAWYDTQGWVAGEILIKSFFSYKIGKISFLFFVFNPVDDIGFLNFFRHIPFSSCLTPVHDIGLGLGLGEIVNRV